MRIGIIGAGISGIAAAKVLRDHGHAVTVFEKSAEIGGIWSVGYPGVRLQNSSLHYRLSTYPWPFAPDRHPTSGQIRTYLQSAVRDLKLDIRTRHEVVALEEVDDGWLLDYRTPEGNGEMRFDFIVIAIGQYYEGKHRPRLPGQDGFEGRIITEREVTDLDVFRDRATVVVGFGKSAVDMATFAVGLSRQVHHVFRTPRWLIPFYLLGISYTRYMFCRAGTFFMPSWVHPGRAAAFVHNRFGRLVHGLWTLISRIIVLDCASRGLFAKAGAMGRLRRVLPSHHITGDLRSASAMAPERYYTQVANGDILPYHAELSAFTPNGVQLADGIVIPCDLVLLCVGSETPRFPFVPDKYRKLLESEHDGVQLYRHLIHPDIPRVAFAGYNHGFMHVPAVEVGMHWLAALLRGELILPDQREMRDSIERVRSWKRRHINFEASRSCAVNTRFQQYLDSLLMDMNISPHRKLPNPFAELFSEYGARDYADVMQAYELSRQNGSYPREVLPLDT